MLCITITNALDKVEITIDSQYLSYLDDNPYYDTSFHGEFTYNDTGYYGKSNFSYRGSYSLNNLLNAKLPQRNWKFKSPKGVPYKGYKVWNYNYEPFLTHILAYILMHDANVPCIEMHQVVLYVNGIHQGLYSEYPDPDNKKWLKETFGNLSDNFVGDLYKAATDKPNITSKYLSDMTVLGENDSDYYLHYNKKTNDSTQEAAADYHSIRNFITILNETPDNQFADTIDKYFDVLSFLRYLVVANYSNFWDGYPNRAKNYWLYHNPYTKKWVFIPWDMDATFNPLRKQYNNMGPECSYLFMYGESNLDNYYTRIYATNDNGKSEITPRPLFTRIMNIEKVRELYASEYKRSLSTYLKKETVLKKIDSIADWVKMASISSSDLLEIDTSVNDTKRFVELRTESLEKQLSSIQVRKPCKRIVAKGSNINFKVNKLSIQLTNNNSFTVDCDLCQINGRIIKRISVLSGAVYTATISSCTSMIIYNIKRNGVSLSNGCFVLK